MQYAVTFSQAFSVFFIVSPFPACKYCNDDSEKISRFPNKFSILCDHTDQAYLNSSLAGPGMQGGGNTAFPQCGLIAANGRSYVTGHKEQCFTFTLAAPSRHQDTINRHSVGLNKRTHLTLLATLC